MPVTYAAATGRTSEGCRALVRHQPARLLGPGGSTSTFAQYALGGSCFGHGRGTVGAVLCLSIVATLVANAVE